MKYNIVIKDNETGEIIKDVDTDAIIAAVNTEENTEVAIITHAPIKIVAQLICSAQDAIKGLIKSDVKLKFAVGFMRFATGKCEEETGATE